MMAWRVHEYGSPDVMRFDRIPRPESGPGDVLAALITAVEFLDGESGCADGGGGVPVEVAAATAKRPYRSHQVLQETEDRVGGADVLEEPQLPGRSQHAAEFGERRLGAGHRTQHQ